MDEGKRKRASRFEILGAWLRLWTPPRDVEVPPIPWRKVGAGAVVLALAGVAVALFVAPEIDEGKKERVAREAEARERAAAARRERVRIAQRPRNGRLPEGATRSAAIAAIGVAIGRDARARFDKEAKAATCEPVPGADASAERVLYDCHAKLRDIVGAGDQEGAIGALTLPYRASIAFTKGTYAFCRVFPAPGEKFITDPRKAVLLPRVCSAYRS